MKVTKIGIREILEWSPPLLEIITKDQDPECRFEMPSKEYANYQKTMKDFYNWQARLRALFDSWDE